METMTALSSSTMTLIGEDQDLWTDEQREALAEAAVATPTDDFHFNVYGTFLVKSIHPDYRELISSQMVGRLVRARRSDNEPEFWFTSSDYAGEVYYRSHRFIGSRVNVKPERGRFYREVIGGHRLLTLAENSEDVFNVLADADDNVWPIPGDTIAVDSVDAYVEVTYTGQHSNVQQEPEVRRESEYVDLTDGFPLFGHGVKVEVEGEAKALVNPPRLEDGKLYVVWGRTARTYSYIALKLPQNDELQVLGRLRGHHDVNTSYNGALSTVITSDPRISEYNLNEITVTEPELGPFQRSLERVQARIEARKTEFSKLNDALSELADEQQWCTEYEGVMQRLNMEGRPVKYIINVEVTLKLTQQGSEGDATLGRMMENTLGIGGKVSGLSYTAQHMLRLDVRGKNREAAYAKVTEELIRQRISNRIGDNSENATIVWDWDGQFTISNSMREDGSPEPANI